LVVILACVPIFLRRSVDPWMLHDTDTSVLLDVIEKPHNALKWFAGDWPLENHFYRPIPTLLFEMDLRLWGDDAAGYGLTNVLLCIGCVLMLFWFVRELTGDVPTATATGVLFALWHTDYLHGPAWWLMYASWALLLLMLLPRRRPWPVIVLFMASYFVLNELPGNGLSGMRNLEVKVAHWLPGRTASSMTFFALAAMAAYCRFERLGARRDAVEPGRLDPPATKSTVAPPAPVSAWPWAVFALILTALALASYEQAVMLPALLVGCAISYRARGWRVRWSTPVLAWVLLAGYLVLRTTLIGWTTSGYQEQQLRTGWAVFADIAEYLFPGGVQFVWYLRTMHPTWLQFLLSDPYWYSLHLGSNIAAAIVAAPRWPLVAFAWLGSVLAFAPMAFLQQSDFHHYHYWPMAMRALMLVLLAGCIGRWFVTAASRRSLQAPLRLHPAPGSLPRQ
jgi:hypothetical protein